VCPLLTSPALPPSPSTPLPLPAALPIYPSVRLGDFYPPHRLRLIGPAPQLFPNGWPVLFQVSRKFVNGHAVHARTPFVGLDSCQCLLAVLPLADLFHQPFANSRAFCLTLRRERFGPFPGSPWGFTRILHREGQQ